MDSPKKPNKIKTGAEPARGNWDQCPLHAGAGSSIAPDTDFQSNIIALLTTEPTPKGSFLKKTPKS